MIRFTPIVVEGSKHFFVVFADILSDIVIKLPLSFFQSFGRFFFRLVGRLRIFATTIFNIILTYRRNIYIIIYIYINIYIYI
ncbi:MAG: hypothetical protein II604_00785, partial [Bacteroidales bacterium]|nr:hypothetical protein [Bacteroidales bacterium]